MTEFWLEYADEIVGTAEQAAAEGMTRTNFGKLEAENRYVKWADGTPVEIELDEFRVLVSDKSTRRSAMLEITFRVNLKEFNPYLSWEYYERKVRVGGPDWRKTLVPSIEAIFGKGSMKDKRGETLSKLIGSYVEVHDVPQQPVKNDKHINPATGEPYGTIKIAMVFPDMESCRAAYVARFGEPTAQEGVGELPPVPSGYDTAEEWEAMHPEIVSFLKRRIEKGMPEAEAVLKAAEEYGVNAGYIQPLLSDTIPY